MLGDLPPSSSVTRFTVSAACLTMILPTAALPVKGDLVHVGMLDKRSAARLAETGDYIDHSRGNPQSANVWRIRAR